MARVILPEEDTAITYQVLKQPRNGSSSGSLVCRRVAGFAVIAIVLLSTAIMLAVLFGLKNAELDDVGLASSCADSNHQPTQDDIQATVTSENFVTNSPTPFAPTTSAEQAVVRPAGAIKWGDVGDRHMSHLNQWEAFINGSAPADLLPPKLVPFEGSIWLDELPLFFELHPGEYCMAVLSNADSFRHNVSNGFDVPQPSAVVVANFSNFYRRLRYNLTATDEMNKYARFEYVQSTCASVPIIPVRQIKPLPQGSYFLEKPNA